MMNMINYFICLLLSFCSHSPNYSHGECLEFFANAKIDNNAKVVRLTFVNNCSQEIIIPLRLESLGPKMASVRFYYLSEDMELTPVKLHENINWDSHVTTLKLEPMNKAIYDLSVECFDFDYSILLSCNYKILVSLKIAGALEDENINLKTILNNNHLLLN